MQKYILIADPSKLSRYVLEKYLSSKYHILQASSFSEAKVILNGIIPSLIIVSYELQDGLGFDLCEFIQNSNVLSKVPVVMLSSNTEVDYRKKAFELGVIDFISKSEIGEGLVKYVDDLVKIIDQSYIAGSRAFIVSRDSEAILEIINVLESTGVKSYIFENHEKLLEKLEKLVPDVIICELFMENTNCFELAKKIKVNEEYSYIPVITLTDNLDNAMVRSFLIHGISDFIDKGQYSFEKILLSLSHQIKTKKLYDELRETNKELYTKATTDALTGLFNRRYFMDHFEQSLYNYKRYGHVCSIIMLDIDHFKNVNDRFGHDAGDLVLKEFSKSLSSFFRKSDIFCRFGGEEFICLIHNIDGKSLITVAENFLNKIRNLKIRLDDTDLKITASIGGVLCGKGLDTTDAVIKMADDLLYMSKKKGRNRATIKVADDIIILE